MKYSCNNRTVQNAWGNIILNNRLHISCRFKVRLDFPLPWSTVAVQNTICCSVNGAMLRDGDTPMECVSISPAPLQHTAVIFSCVKSAGNYRHSFSFFPTYRKAWTQSGRATQRHLEGRFKVNEEQGFEFLNQSINGKINIHYHSRCSDPFIFTMKRLDSDTHVSLTLLQRKPYLSTIIRSQ